MEKFKKGIKDLGGKAYLVGGAVRDSLLSKPIKDRDFVITGVSESDFCEKFKFPEKVGKSFPVYLLDIDGEKCEIAFARQEKKVGAGHTDFEVCFDQKISIKDDLLRRDLTINSMAIDISTGEMVDPFKGYQDLKFQVLRAVSESFKEDALRTLRVARFHTLLGFDVDEKLKALMYETKKDLEKVAWERKLLELEKAFKGVKPSAFFEILKETKVLDVAFPLIHKMVGIPQPLEHHPEGDVFQHSLLVLDKARKETTDFSVLFSALFHDLGKTETPTEKLPRHFDHDTKGSELVETLDVFKKISKKTKEMLSVTSKFHMKAPRFTKQTKIVDAILEIGRTMTFKDFKVLLQADGQDIPDWVVKGDELYPLLVAKTKEIKKECFLEGKSAQQTLQMLFQERAELLKKEL